MRKFVKLSLLLIAVFVTGTLFTGCGEDGDNLVLAKVGDRNIYASDLNEIFELSNQGFASFEEEFQHRRIILDSLVIRQLLIIEAYNRNIDKLEEVSGLVLSNKDKFLLDILYVREIEDKAIVEENDIRDHYSKLEYKYRASHILLATEDSAKMVLDSIQKGGIFEDLAVAYSIDPSAQQNRGDLGFFTWGRMVGTFQEEVIKLNPGEISMPFETRYGWHIVKMVEKTPNEARQSYTNMFESMKESVKNQKKGELMQAFRDSLEARNPVTVDRATVEYIFHKRENLYPPQVLETMPRNDFDPSQLDRNDKELILATWQGGNITLGEYLSRVRQFRSQMSPPDLDDYEELEDFIFQMNAMDLLANEARRQGLEDDPEFEKKLLKFKELTMADVMENDSLELYQAPDEGELRQYYEDHIDDYRVDAKIHVHEIMFPTKELADEYKRKIRTFGKFKEIAAQMTERPGKRKQEGNMGYILEQYYPRLYAEAEATPVGGIGGPVEINNKYSLIYVVDKKAEEIRDFLTVKENIVNQLEKEKKDEALSEWVEQMKKTIDIQIYENNIRPGIDKTKYASADSTQG
jgi:parvulin-like peptidyl-prolyl isomerase